MTCEAKFWGHIGCGCDACDLARREQVKAFAERKLEELEWADRLRDARIRIRESMPTSRPPCMSHERDTNSVWWEEVAA